MAALATVKQTYSQTNLDKKLLPPLEQPITKSKQVILVGMASSGTLRTVLQDIHFISLIVYGSALYVILLL